MIYLVLILPLMCEAAALWAAWEHHTPMLLVFLLIGAVVDYAIKTAVHEVDE